MITMIALVFILLVVFGIFISIAKRSIDQKVSQETKHVEELNQELLKKEDDLNRQLSEAEQKAQEMLDKAQEEAEDTRVEILKRAETERENIIKQGTQHSQEMLAQAEQSRQKILREFDERVAKEAINKAVGLIQGALPEEFKQVVHGRWVEELITHGFVHFERLHIPQDVQEATVTSAFALTETQRENIQHKLNTLLEKSIVLKEEVDSGVVAGISITLGSIVLDGTLKNKIREKVNA
ncbi:MAG: F0F1 ATP synthase subunit delta [Candidatus Omnitrophica bacterium]|nr:F0F1 ATP synthase subunit delta [Candidatus Omnitrophota bacterium]